MQSLESRIIRGYEILVKGDEPKQLDDSTFQVPSQSGNGVYLVSLFDDEWRCECPDHMYRSVECKHIYVVKFWLAIKDQIVSEVEETIPEIVYPQCGSEEIKKNGSRMMKVGKRRRYRYLQCDKSFMLDEAFKKVIGDPKIFSSCLDLYFKGISLRKIADHVKQFNGLDVSHITVYNWVKRYMKLVNAYVEKLNPHFGAMWYVDEMKVKNGGQWSWLWNVMDAETRFMLVTTISKTRNIQDARRVFQKAKETAQQDPQFIVSDGLPAYIKAFKKEFYSRYKAGRVEHIRKPRFTDPTNNNIVERLNGTVREREKLMRGMKGDDTPRN